VELPGVHAVGEHHHHRDHLGDPALARRAHQAQQVEAGDGRRQQAGPGRVHGGQQDVLHRAGQTVRRQVEVEHVLGEDPADGEVAGAPEGDEQHTCLGHPVADPRPH
jgi:hypothetical protein